MSYFRSTVIHLTPLVKQTAEDLHYLIPKAKLWSKALSFAIFAFALLQMLNTLEVLEDKSDSKEIEYLF